ncbi:unnamed protein product [Penicillium manginii]
MRFLNPRSLLKPSQASEQTRVYSHGTNDQPMGGSRIRTGNIQLTSVNDETSALQKALNHVLIQLHEVKRLRQAKESLLECGEKYWVDNTINDVADATRDVALLLEPTRVEKETGSGRLSIGSQLRWKYRHSERAKEKKDRMMTCHNSLMSVLAHLQRIETPKTTIIHELGVDIPPKASLYSIRNLSRLDVGSDVVFEDAKEGDKLDSKSQEMNDLLAWRRSKGSPKVTRKESELADT